MLLVFPVLFISSFDNRNTFPSEGASHGWNEDVV